MGEVSSLLSEANALEVQLANDGALSSDEKAAIQGQVNSILQTVDRIGRSTTFNGQKLLDGSATLTPGGATLDLPTTSTTSLGQTDIGGTTYRLADVGSAGPLGGDPASAQQVIQTAIMDVATARGQVGAFQSTTIEPLRNSIGVAIENVAAAESAIRDTDYAAATANLARLRTLNRALIQTLGILNENQNSRLALFG